MKRISLIYLGTTGAGPVYSYEMAKALCNSGKCILQIIVSDQVSNLQTWYALSKCQNAELRIISAYKRSKISVLFSLLNIKKQESVVDMILNFHADVLYVPFMLFWAPYIYYRLKGRVKIFTTIHDLTIHDKYRNVHEMVSRIMFNLSKRYVSTFIVLNNQDKHILQKQTTAQVICIPHASMNFYRKDCELTPTELHMRIGFLGRIEPYKGVDLLVDAFEFLSNENIKLLIAGSGNIDQSLLKRINNNKRIEFINRYIKDEEFESILSSVDFVVLPYKRASQSGVIPLCFAFGKTVIATNVGALAEQVPNGVGIVVAPDAKIIAKEIEGLYFNPEKIITMGKKARAFADNNLTWEKSAATLLNYI